MEKACKGWEILNAKDFRDINPGDRILMGPGPSDVPARTLQALAAPCIGHLDPYFLEIMNEVQQLLRFLFQTDPCLRDRQRRNGNLLCQPGRTG
jgi:aspartate aminotransferase-like enzyme